MPITIPDDIRYNRRDYTIGNVIELNDSMLGDNPLNNPIFVLMLKYIVSPFSTNDYNDIEDNLKYFLNVPLMVDIANSDEDVEFNEEEYRKHITYAKKKLLGLTAETLLEYLLPYAGDTKSLKYILEKGGLLDEGKKTLVSEFKTEIGTDHLLSAHSKGIESKKIWQAADKRIPYEPALDDINEILTEKGKNKNMYITTKVEEEPTIIKIGKANLDRMKSTYIIDISFEGLFEKLFTDAGIRPISRREREKPKKKKPSDPTPLHGTDAMREALDRSKSVKKALIAILKEDDEQSKYDSLPFKVYNPTAHKNISLDNESMKILYNINLKLGWNKLLTKGIGEDLEEYEGDLEALMAGEDIKEADMKEAVNFIDLLYDRGLIKKATFDKFLNGEGFPSQFGLNKSEKELINEIIIMKTKSGLGLTELEIKYRKATASAKGREVYDRNETEQESLDRTAPIVHAPLYTSNSDRRLFGKDSWRTPETITLDLLNARGHSRALHEALMKEALIPKEVGILRLTLTTVHDDADLESRRELLDDEDEDVKANAKLLVEKIYDVFRLVAVEYIVKDTFGFRPHTERRPELRSGSNPKAEKPKIPGYERPQDPLLGRLPEGGPPTHVDIRANSIKYYVKRQVAMLEEMMKNG
tara:strand:+ start:19 stop:1947 length:1929 start_codon:yes stop_codon:yes gene_type:complete